MAPALRTSLHLAALLMAHPAAAVGLAVSILAGAQPSEAEEAAGGDDTSQLVVHVIDFDHLTLGMCLRACSTDDILCNNNAAQPKTVHCGTLEWSWPRATGGRQRTCANPPGPGSTPWI